MDFVHLNSPKLRRCMKMPDAAYEFALVRAASPRENATAGTPGGNQNRAGNAAGTDCYAPGFCCAQFMLTRAALQGLTREFYRNAGELYGAFDSKHKPGFHHCQMPEHLWHTLFRRQRRFSGPNLAGLLSAMNGSTSVR